MKRIVSLPVAALAIIAAIAQMSARAAVLGTDFVRTSWTETWTGDFTAIDIDGASFAPFDVEGSSLSYNEGGWDNGNYRPSALERQYTREVGDTSAYSLAVAASVLTWATPSDHTYSIVYSIDGGDWIEVATSGPVAPYTWGYPAGTITVGADVNDLRIRYLFQNLGAWRQPAARLFEVHETFTEVVPEPASIALLGLCSLTLLRRRR